MSRIESLGLARCAACRGTRAFLGTCGHAVVVQPLHTALTRCVLKKGCAFFQGYIFTPLSIKSGRTWKHIVAPLKKLPRIHERLRGRACLAFVDCNRDKDTHFVFIFVYTLTYVSVYIRTIETEKK